MPTLSRRHLVTTAAALPALAVPAAVLPAAALPTAAARFTIDREAMVSRAQQIVDVLGRCYVREGWKLDTDRAAQFVENVRTFDEKREDGYCPKFEMALDWMHDHGQSLDWLFIGRIDEMIATHAARGATVGISSNMPTYLVDAEHAELIALGDELLRLWPEFVAACDAFNEAREPDGGPADIRFCAINDRLSELAGEIMEIPSRTLAGLRVKVLASIHTIDPIHWDGSFDELDPDGGAFRSLIEAVCAVVGIDLAKHLGMVLS
jgi:hypothetical protein